MESYRGAAHDYFLNELFTQIKYIVLAKQQSKTPKIFSYVSRDTKTNSPHIREAETRESWTFLLQKNG